VCLGDLFSKKIKKNDTVFFLAVFDARHARVTMGDSADSDADDPLFRETGADMSTWLSRRDADKVGPDLAPVPVGLTRRKNCVVLLRSKRTTKFFFWQLPTPTPTRARDDGRLGRLRRGRPFVPRDWSRYVQVVVSARRRRGWPRSRACSCGEEKTVSFFCETKEQHSFFSGSF